MRLLTAESVRFMSMLRICHVCSSKPELSVSFPPRSPGERTKQ
nr:MAG TPA: hypothetical protein [Caudoviricetes sp.]